MVTFPNKWKTLKSDEKPKQTNKLKTTHIYLFFPLLLKGRFKCQAFILYNASIKEYTWSHDRCMQVKRDIETTIILHKLPIYYKNTCLHWASTLCCMIYCLFSKCKHFTCLANVPCSYVPVLIAMQWSLALKSAFYRCEKKDIYE